jgi:hypothetical protein
MEIIRIDFSILARGDRNRGQSIRMPQAVARRLVDYWIVRVRDVRVVLWLGMCERERDNRDKRSLRL